MQARALPCKSRRAHTLAIVCMCMCVGGGGGGGGISLRRPGVQTCCECHAQARLLATTTTANGPLNMVVEAGERRVQ